MLQPGLSSASARAELIKAAAVIIWDEAPMANRAVLSCVDETCRIVMNDDRSFGGKLVICVGDFRQTCPVVRGGSRAQVVDASIRSSPLWQDFDVMHLSTPIRNAEDPGFATFVDSIGDGAGPEVDLSSTLRTVTTEEDMILFVYPQDILNDPTACLTRAILCPTNAQVDVYNNTLLDRIESPARIYIAADTLQEVANAGIVQPDGVLDYVARHSPPGMPPHTLKIKLHAVFRLLRNFSIDLGLVKNTRVVVVGMGNRLITVRILRGIGGVNSIIGEDILIPRISFTSVLPSGHTLLRRQFPLAPAYATTFNSCQGLTLDRVGVDLTRDVFSHGQLYTALSRIRNRSHACVRLRTGEHCTKNVTYEELLL